MNNSYIKLKKLFKEHSLLSDINSILNWDMATFMPEKSRFQRKTQIKVINEYKKNLFEQIKKSNLLNQDFFSQFFYRHPGDSELSQNNFFLIVYIHNFDLKQF